MSARPRVRDITNEIEDLRRRSGDDEVIADLFRYGDAVYTPQGLERFLTTPLDEFDGRTALDLIDAGQTERVVEVLAGDYTGLGY